MAKTALIIEDDESVGRLLFELCGKLGISAEVVRNGKEGFERAKKQPPDVLLLDLLLPGLDGFKIAEGLKAAGLSIPLIVVTGVYKDGKVAKEFGDRYGADYFLKPLRIDEVKQALARKLGLAVDAPEPNVVRRASLEVPGPTVAAMEGSLRSRPFSALVMELARGKASGTLDLEQGQVRRRIFFNRGFVRFAQSNVKGENVGGMQVAEGRITEADFSAAVQRAREERISIGEALALAAVIDRGELPRFLRRQVEEVVLGAFAAQDGTFRFAPGDTDRIQDARQSAVALLLSAYKRFVTAEQAQTLLAAQHDATVARSADFDRELFTLRGVFSGETLSPMINGRLKIGDVTARARRDDLPLLLALLQTGLATLTGAAPAAARPQLPVVTAVNPSRPFTAEERAARTQIEAEHARVSRAATYYDVLCVEPNCSTEQVKAAYLPLARRWHADAFTNLVLGDAAPRLQEIFGKISEASSVLSDEKRRADYDVLLDRQAKGLPTDVEVIFKAEAAAARGDALMKQGRFADAEGAYKEALKFDASVAQYHAALGLAVLRARGATAASEALASLDKALSLNADFVTARVYKAVVLGQTGNESQAMGLLREVLAAQPDHVEASRELRALKERSRKDEGKGLLGKLFKR